VRDDASSSQENYAMDGRLISTSCWKSDIDDGGLRISRRWMQNPAEREVAWNSA
jgi:hypothetical protein